MADLQCMHLPRGRFVNTRSIASAGQPSTHQKATREPDEQTSTTKTFKFITLPVKIRHLIWEATFPEPRIIGHRTAAVENNTARELIHYLGVLGSVETYSHANYLDILNHSVIERCSNPITLQICRESRLFTLRTYIPMMNGIYTYGSFYFDPRRDILLLCWDFEHHRPTLESCYGTQMRYFENVMVDGHFWVQSYSTYYERAVATIRPNPEGGISWLFEAMYDAWGVHLDACRVTAAVKFVSVILSRVEVFTRLHGRPMLVENTRKMVVQEFFEDVESEDGVKKVSLGIRGREMAFYIYLSFVEMNFWDDGDDCTIDAVHLCDCDRHSIED
ncbi:hypothetical protein BO94DRAFT_18606 [Aspergillus sclerotioniger CBS 115572]|uniref:2EXR domain-containing protein n=1 Tax=Aspergillus sclerotioniger CBS 115572 TaxID=1450535 RepID=A0A317XE16_9EURO|nr:hypothetical protein BO94DRAFT_18606 [Aspergillus sclerotioniger CBS 115572]PWY96743.1 hypothetical protein BO94DRAFT_18606 [Aspergillus sclerotioniger CBS 115572]